MNPSKLFRTTGLVVAAGTLFASALVVTACGGDDDDDTAAATPTTVGATATAGTKPTEAVPAGVFKAGSIEVSNVSARASTGMTSAVYMQIKSTGEADRLLSATSTIANATQVHETVVDGGSMKMNELKEGLAIPAGGMVELKTGSYHVMLMGLQEEMKDGGTVKVTLTFEKAGTLEITAPIKTIAATMGMN